MPPLSRGGSGGASNCSSDVPWGDLPGARPVFGVEVEVPRGFQAPGPGPWLECAPGEVLLVERTTHRGQAFAVTCSGDREGWLNLEAVQPPHRKFHEFQVLIPTAISSLKRLGIAYTKVLGPICGLAVGLVLPDSMVDDYNTAMRATFPRSQLLEGDVITWAGGATDPDEMRRILASWREQRPALRMRVNRIGLCRAASTAAPATQAAGGAAGALPTILMYSESPGLAVPTSVSSPAASTAAAPRGEGALRTHQHSL